MGQLQRMVTAYLDFAESMTLRHIPLTMADWEQRLNSFINLFEYGLLNDAGRVTAEIARLHAETEFEKYRIIQDQLFLSDYDRFLLEMKEIEKKTWSIKRKKTMKNIPYQQNAVNELTDKTIHLLNLGGKRHKIVFEAPTGAGKR